MEIGGEKPNISSRWLDFGSEGVKFHIKGLNNFEISDINQCIAIRTMGTDSKAILTPLGKRLSIERGLIDWKGVLIDGKPIKFDLALVDDFPDTAIDFIAYEVYLASLVDEPTKKKSSSQRTLRGIRKSTTAKRAKKGTAVKKRKRRLKSIK